MSGKTILVADDDAAVIDYLRAKLGARFRLVGTTEPTQVLALARDQRPDLIVCDVDMPDLDGGDISGALFADDALRDIPLLFLTALAAPEDLARAAGQLGGRPAVSKKAPLAELVQRIEALIGA